MARIIGISGSLRQGSYNTGLLQAAAELLPPADELLVRTIHGIPLYDPQVEADQGVPEVVARLKDEIADADGLILATPEYNHSMPGVLKNAVDWLSRPSADIKRVFGGKPVAILGATPGGFGTLLSQTAWLPVLRCLGTRPWGERRLFVSRAQELFDDDGRLSDEKTREQLQAFLHDFLAFVAAQA